MLLYKIVVGGLGIIGCLSVLAGLLSFLGAIFSIRSEASTKKKVALDLFPFLVALPLAHSLLGKSYLAKAGIFLLLGIACILATMLIGPLLLPIEAG